MTLEQGLGMLTLGIFAIFIGGLIAYFIINKLKDWEFERGINNCKNDKEIEDFIKRWNNLK